MKAKDFRIGNLVQIDYDDRVFEMHTIADTYPTLNTSEFGIGVVEWYNIKPIKITEEWLLIFGFEKLIKNSFKIEKTNFTIYINPVTGVCWISNKNQKGIAVIPVTFMYVHELQNLYYALTKEELKINQL
jgi:hypothetical protein